MTENGLFITLYDMNSLSMYIDNGVFGSLMTPVFNIPSPHSIHYNVLADYACCRENTHVFFFLNRAIFYGGQIIGSINQGAFYLNGNTSPLGKEINAKLVWDESTRYKPTKQAGVFTISKDHNEIRRSQPVLIRFQDKLGLRNKKISSDQLYFELGKLPFPLPSNTVQGMSFCTLTPVEANELLVLFKNNSQEVKLENYEKIKLLEEPAHFSAALGIQNIKNDYMKNKITRESHLEFSVIANPLLLPSELQPHENEVICRQVPISPFKPFNIDRADICYYKDGVGLDGALPTRIIELKNSIANQDAVNQVTRYLKWLYKISEKDAKNITCYIYAPSFRQNVRVDQFNKQIHLVTFT